MVNLGPLGPDAEERARIKALKPEDREWLTKHGWRDTTDDYPPIGTETVRDDRFGAAFSGGGCDRPEYLRKARRLLR